MKCGTQQTHSAVGKETEQLTDVARAVGGPHGKMITLDPNSRQSQKPAPGGYRLGRKYTGQMQLIRKKKRTLHSTGLMLTKATSSIPAILEAQP